MGVVIQFSYSDWVVRFPEFAYLPEAQVRGYFDMATTFIRNDGGGPVSTAATQTTLLYLATAHIAALFAPNANGSANSTGVGRVSSASEGSVSVSLEYGASQSEMAAWYSQTKYGALLWMMMAQYRTFRYVPGPGAFRNFGGRVAPGAGLGNIWPW